MKQSQRVLSLLIPLAMAAEGVHASFDELYRQDPKLLIQQVQREGPAVPEAHGSPLPPQASDSPKGPSLDTILGDAGDSFPARLVKAGVLVNIENFAQRDQGSGWYRCYERLEKAVQSSPELLERVHEIRIRKDSPGARIEPDSDGGRALVLSFDFERYSYKPRTPSEAPQLNLDGSVPNRSVMTWRVLLPEAEAIQQVLSTLGPRPDVLRYRFDRRFPALLARYHQLLRVEDTHSKDASGRYIFHKILESYGDEVGLIQDLDWEHSDWRKPRFVGLANFRTFIHEIGGSTPVFMLRPGSSPRMGLETHWTWKLAGFFGDPVYKGLMMFAEYDPGYGEPQAPSLKAIDECFGKLWDQDMNAGVNTRYREKGWTCP